MYHSGNRELQEHFGSTALADRLLQITHRTNFTDEDKIFIEKVPFFFLATADTNGCPDCSFKGGSPGFIQITGANTLVFPDYDGNGMFKSLGNIRTNPNVGLLFISVNDTPKRLRVNGHAGIDLAISADSAFTGAQALITVTARHIFPNCPRYIPDMKSGAPSRYIPVKGAPPVEPAWKEFASFKDVVPRRKA